MGWVASSPRRRCPSRNRALVDQRGLRRPSLSRRRRPGHFAAGDRNAHSPSCRASQEVPPSRRGAARLSPGTSTHHLGLAVCRWARPPGLAAIVAWPLGRAAVRRRRGWHGGSRERRLQAALALSTATCATTASACRVRRPCQKRRRSSATWVPARRKLPDRAHRSRAVRRARLRRTRPRRPRAAAPRPQAPSARALRPAAGPRGALRPAGRGALMLMFEPNSRSCVKIAAALDNPDGHLTVGRRGGEPGRRVAGR